MTQATSNIFCPQCGSEELYLIGAVVRGQSGIKYTGTVADSLEIIKPEILEGTLVCKSCKRQTNTQVVNPLSGLAPTECMWEFTSYGTKVPIVCPICKNKKVFTKEVLEQRTRAVTYAPNAKGEFVPQDQGVVLGDVDQLVIRYRCDVENCSGTITLNDEDKYSLKSH